MNTDYDKIREALDAKVKARAEQRESYSKKLESAKVALRTALERKSAMISAEDRKGVRAARDEEGDARADIEIYQAKLDALPERSVIDHEEAERILSQIRKAHSDKWSEVIKAAKPHVAALLKLSAEYTESAAEADALAKRVAFSLCDSDAFYVMVGGKRRIQKPITIGHDDRFGALVDKMAYCELLKPLFGIDPKKDNNRAWGIPAKEE